MYDVQNQQIDLEKLLKKFDENRKIYQVGRVEGIQVVRTILDE